MSDKTFRRFLVVIFSCFILWATYQFGYVRGYADACRWCTSLYGQEN